MPFLNPNRARRKRYGFDEMVIQPDDYQRYVADNQTGDRQHYYAHGISGNGWTARPWHLDEKLHPSTWTVTEALRFLERRDPTCPFFLVVSFNAPHPLLTPPAFYLDRYLRVPLPEPFIGDWATPPPNRGLGNDVQSDHVDLRGAAPTLDREFIHGEHATSYSYAQANHFLTDGKEKYIWYTSNGAEQLFDLARDPGETRNLAADPSSAAKLALWRQRLIERLKGRPEGFTDGERLIPGRPHPALLPHVGGAGSATPSPRDGRPLSR